MLGWWGETDAEEEEEEWEISPEDVAARLEAGDDVVVIDVRTPEEYARGHIAGSWLIPLHELPGRLSEIDPDQEIVLVCRSGHRSMVACQFLRRAGISRAWSMRGGMLEWMGEIVQGAEA